LRCRIRTGVGIKARSRRFGTKRSGARALEQFVYAFIRTPHRIAVARDQLAFAIDHGAKRIDHGEHRDLDVADLAKRAALAAVIAASEIIALLRAASRTLRAERKDAGSQIAEHCACQLPVG